MKRIALMASPLLAAFVLSGCGGVLDPSGSGAEEIRGLWWWMFWLSLIPVVIVTVMLAVIVVRRRRSADPDERVSTDSSRRDNRLIILGGVVLPVVILIPVAIVAIATATNRPQSDPDTLEVGVTGHQYWWDVTYPAPGNQRLTNGDTFRTANEIHVPVGTPVEFRLRSEDVIHSFWVPELDGKMDMIPGRTNRLTIQANEPGTYQGICAEFCGLSHTNMRFLVVAQPEEEFEEWREEQNGPAVDGLDEDHLEAFADDCGVCHDLRGVFEERSFRGDFGPDLTHFGSRRTIGADLLPMTPEALGRWIADPEGVKPGNRMPDVGLEGDELADMVELLEELE